MKRFLVTGGNGYIGSHMCQHLYEQGHEVVTIDSYITSPKEPVHSYAKFYEGDIGDRKFVSGVLNAHRFDGVFHFAALSVVSESEEKPFLYFQNNTTKSTIFFETLIEHRVNNIIFSSTSSTYGANPTLEFLNEDSPQTPSNAYAVSKKLVEDVLIYLSQKYKLNSAILRYFNVAGNDPQLRIGENHEPESHLIPNLCRSAISEKSVKFKLFGDQHPTPDGTCIRDYIHVCDLVRAHALAFENMKSQSGLQVFNLGSGKGYSVKEVMREFEMVTQIPLDFEIYPPRDQDPPRLVCDITKAKTELGFQNEFNLKDCISHTFNYLKRKSTPHQQM